MLGDVCARKVTGLAMWPQHDEEVGRPGLWPDQYLEEIASAAHYQIWFKCREGQ